MILKFFKQNKLPILVLAAGLALIYLFTPLEINFVTAPQLFTANPDGSFYLPASSSGSSSSCSGSTCQVVSCDPDHATCVSSCSSDADCGASPPPSTTVTCDGGCGQGGCASGERATVERDGSCTGLYLRTVSCTPDLSCTPSSSCTPSCGEFSSCSVECGGGTQSQTCTRSDCSTYTNTQSCNTQECVTDFCTLFPWLCIQPPTYGCSGSSCVLGGGGSSCTSDADCGVPILTYGCSGSSCVLGGGGSACSSDADCGVPIIVNDPPKSDCVNISVPGTVTAGSSFSALVTMKNSGTVHWSDKAALGSKNPKDNTRWGLSRVGLPFKPVNPGQVVDFNFTATATTTVGTYHFDWAMVDEDGKTFGQTCAANIAVSPPTLPGNFNLNSGSVTCNSVPLTWTASSGAQGYRILKGSARVDISPYQPYTALNFIDTTVSQNTAYQFQIEAYNTAGTNRSNEIRITTPFCPPTLNFSANPTSIFQGQSSTLSWATTYVTSCTASSAPNQNSWGGSKAINGSQIVVPLPPPSVTYNLQCSGPGGTSPLKSAIINISPLALPNFREIIPR